MRIERSQGKPCTNCTSNDAKNAIRMGTKSWTQWNFYLCDNCFDELKTLERPPKPRYEIERYDLNVWPSCHPPKALTIENRAWGIKEHNKGYTATQAHFCKSCAEKVAKVLNEGQS